MTLCGVRTIGKIVIIAMPAQIDHVAALTVEHELREPVSRGPQAMLCDFSATEYISSSGLRVLLATAKSVKAAGGHFGVFSLTPFVDHILTMSGFANLFTIYDNEKAAVREASRLAHAS